VYAVTATWIAITGVILSPAITLLLFRAAERKRERSDESAQNITLAVLATKIDAIPAVIKGEIAAAMTKHVEQCPARSGAGGATSIPRLQAYSGPIAPDEG
jgi:hypothetical protein